MSQSLGPADPNKDLSYLNKPVIPLGHGQIIYCFDSQGVLVSIREEPGEVEKTESPDLPEADPPTFLDGPEA